MARLPRAVIAGVPLHIIQRGNDRTTTFRSVDDFVHFRVALREASQRFACAIHAYVLMSNHVHLLLTPEDDVGPSRMMQVIGPRYVHYVNERYARTGTLWEGRYRSSLIDSERYLLTCSRYIELNPVRAGMVGGPAAYRWSSYRHNAFGEPDDLVTPHWVYQALGKRLRDRQAAYRALFRGAVDSDCLDAIRVAARRGEPLGTDAFRAWVETCLERPVMRQSHGGDRRQPFQEL